jgi:hypothetical protein
MRKLLNLCVAATLCLGLFGCPYESQVPIGLPTNPVDTRLLGTWNSKDEVYNTYTVSKASETEYTVIQKNISNTAKFTGYLTEIKGTPFMNLYSDSTGTYYLYRVKMDASATRFSLTPLAQNLPDHFGSIDGLRNYVEKNMNFKTLYDEGERTDFEKLEEYKPTASN